MSEHPGDLLSAYLDGELSAAEARDVEAHMLHCGRCSAELDDLSSARQLLRTLPPVPAPAGFTHGLIERRQRWTRRGATLAVAAAGVAVLAGLVLAEPARDDEPGGQPPLAVTGDANRLDTTFGARRPSAPPGDLDEPLLDEPLTARGEGTTTTVPGPTTVPRPGPTTVPPPGPTTLPTTTPTTTAPTTGPAPSSTTTTAAANDAGSEQDSDPVTFGDRLDEVATHLLELIGG